MRGSFFFNFNFFGGLGVRTFVLLRFLPIGFFLFFLCGRLNAQETNKMTLDDCIEYALKNNPNYRVAQLENDISNQKIKEAIAYGLPQISARVSVTNNFEIQRNYIPDFISPAVYNVLLSESLLPTNTQIPSPATFPVAFSTNYTGIMNFELSQLIFDGSYIIGNQAAKNVRSLSLGQQTVTKVDVIERVSKLYYMVLINGENIDFLGKNFAKIDTLLNDTKLMYENGFAEKLDLNRIQLQHNNLKTRLTNDTRSLIVSILLLKLSMGMPVENPLLLANSIEDFEPHPFDNTDQEQSYSGRPEYILQQRNVENLSLQIKHQQVLHAPKLYLKGNLGWNLGTSGFSDLFDKNRWAHFSNVSLTLSIPIFDGLIKTRKIQQIQSKKRQLQIQMDYLKNSISKEVQQSKIKYENAKNDVKNQEENIKLALDIYQTTKIKYEQGLGTNYEVVDANTSYEESKRNHLKSLYDMLVSELELKKALGILHQP